MNSFDSVCVEELNGFADWLAMQELQAAEMAEFAEWIDTTLPTAEEMDQWFERDNKIIFHNFS